MNIPENEAEMLSIYFEEVAAHNYRTNKKYSSGSGSSGDSITDFEVPDEEDSE